MILSSPTFFDRVLQDTISSTFKVVCTALQPAQDTNSFQEKIMAIDRIAKRICAIALAIAAVGIFFGRLAAFTHPLFFNTMCTAYSFHEISKVCRNIINLFSGEAFVKEGVFFKWEPNHSYADNLMLNHRDYVIRIDIQDRVSKGAPVTRQLLNLLY